MPLVMIVEVAEYHLDLLSEVLEEVSPLTDLFRPVYLNAAEIRQVARP